VGRAPVNAARRLAWAFLSQTRAKAAWPRFSLGFIMLSDVVVVIVLALPSLLAAAAHHAGSSISIDDFNVLGHEILGSISWHDARLALAIYLASSVAS